jgi:hypothetical protein
MFLLIAGALFAAAIATGGLLVGRLPDLPDDAHRELGVDEQHPRHELASRRQGTCP